MSQAFARCGCVDGADLIVPDELGIELLSSGRDPSVTLEEYLPLAEAKLHCKVDLSEDDALIQSYIAAARSLIEHDTERAWVEAGFIARYAITQPASPIPLEPYPVSAVSKVEKVPASGAPTDITGSHVHEDTGLLYPPPEGWPLLPDDTVRVTYEAGPPAAEVPPDILHATRLLVGQWYDHRSAITEAPATPLPFAVVALIAPYRRSIGISFS
jgi:uncharacterized phiE125 gp8 family phage protein